MTQPAQPEDESDHPKKQSSAKTGWWEDVVNPTSAIGILVFTALSYIAAYRYVLGQYDYFGIPEGLISVGVLELVSLGSALIVFTYVLITNLNLILLAGSYAIQRRKWPQRLIAAIICLFTACILGDQLFGDVWILILLC